MNIFKTKGIAHDDFSVWLLNTKSFYSGLKYFFSDQTHVYFAEVSVYKCNIE